MSHTVLVCFLEGRRAMPQEGIAKGDPLQRISSLGFIGGAAMVLLGGLLLPRSLGIGNWQQMQSEVGAQAVRLQACALLIMLGYCALVLGTAGLHGAITAGGAAWARLGFYLHLMGTTLWLVGMTLDVSYPAAIRSWLASPAADKAAAYSAVVALPAFGRGTFPLGVIVMWMSFVFLGLGMAQSAVYPRWLGWVGVILGAGGVSLGISQIFTGREVSLTIFTVLLLLTMLWSLAIGAWVARRAWW
jgi:hypothetical protein